MLYQNHDFQSGGLKFYFALAASTLRLQSALFRTLNVAGNLTGLTNGFNAAAAIAQRFAKDYPKQAFGFAGQGVTEEIICDKPFGSLLHFKRDTTRNDPKILLVAPMSGHYATLLRGMINDLLPHHDVYITDWKNARDVPLKDGNFNLEDYIGYLQDFIEAIGPETNLVGISQSTVPVLAVTALMSANQSPVQPRSMTLMCGPIDTRISPTAIDDYAKNNSLRWFKENVIAAVPTNYAGAGRLVYPGFMQLSGLKASDPERHTRANLDLFRHVYNGNDAEADKIRKFYDEYDAVMDSADQFYLDTIYHVFQNHTLAKGDMTWRGQKIDPALISRTAMLTVEGQKDAICGNGQTLAAHSLCAGLPDKLRFVHSEPGAGHYDILSPQRIAGFVRHVAAQNNIAYDAVPEGDMIAPLSQKLDSIKKQLSFFTGYVPEQDNNVVHLPHRRHG